MRYIDRFYEHRWGVFNHFLYVLQNNPSLPNSNGKSTSWDELVNEFDTDKLARQLSEIGAKYYVITVMQGTKYMIAPNAAFDKIAGTRPGEACSTRDLMLDIYNSLYRYDIDLFLYFTGDGPYKNEEVGSKFGFIEPRSDGVTMDFVKKWASVLEEYSVRYGDKIKGWWIDGCYRDHFKYTDELLEPLYNACKKGNPDAVVALNGGVGNELKINYPKEDFVCGEFNELDFIPKERFVDGKAQAHILAPLGTSDSGIGASWGSFGIRYTKEYLVEYVGKVHNAGGVVTFDIGVYRDGGFCPEHIEALKYLSRNVWFYKEKEDIMPTVTLNFNKKIGDIKIMHAVNNGPIVTKADQKRGNQETYRAARIPYARNHDAGFESRYGGEHTVDVHAIFPNFDADVNDPESYDFVCTDKYMADILSVGTKPFYRLGSKIEHGVKKYGTIMPKDFKKWAQICEHIIAHYTEGWANGFNYNIEYWEIWNEPDLDPEDSTDKRCWSGTEADYARLYEISAKYLKARFPHLKIGGPALAWNEDWLMRFFARIDPKTPLDFISWHWYGTEPREMAKKGSRIADITRRAGFKSFESILNEWNYVRGWGDEFIYSIEQVIGIKGAAFTSACMACGQNNPDIDMLMYYDARPTGFNGLFDIYTLRPIKGYYPFLIYSKLYELKNQTQADTNDDDLYVVSASNEEHFGAMITYYSEDDNKMAKRVEINALGADLTGATIYVVDKDNTMTQNVIDKFENGKATLYLERNSIVYIEK